MFHFLIAWLVPLLTWCVAYRMGKARGWDDAIAKGKEISEQERKRMTSRRIGNWTPGEN